MRKKDDFAIIVKLLAFLCVMTAVFVTKASAITPLVFALAMMYLLFQRKYKPCLGYILFYGTLYILLFCIREYGYKTIILPEFHLFLWWWLTPIFMVSIDLASSPPGQISSFLSKIHTPTPVILGTLVVFRFFPTMKSEMRALKESMHNRRLTATTQIILHPATTFEYILVPLLLRCVQIADQLAISALSRGIETPVKRTSYYDKALSLKDYIGIAFCLLSTAGIIIGGMI